MANPTFFPFLYGSTAHLPPRVYGSSDSVVIDIGQHPIIFSRAVGTLQPDEKLDENEAYLRECRRICEETCPIRNSPQFNVICKRISLTKAIAVSMDHSKLEIIAWKDILKYGLCKPKLY